MKPHEPYPCRSCGHDVETPAPDHCQAPARHISAIPADFRRRIAWFKAKRMEEK